ncbi:transposase [Salinibacter ruber]|uniref:transposase n=1 Tax=Salinibacter ruber TaxID=146919 RepID=UPI00216784B3
MKNAAGQYHVCFVCTEEVELLPRVNGENGDLEFVGVDLGIESLVTLSTGEKVGNLRWFENEYKRLRREQQKLSRKEALPQRGSPAKRKDLTTGSGNENVWRRSTNVFRIAARTSSRS